jgi:hypothetical protein
MFVSLVRIDLERNSMQLVGKSDKQIPQALNNNPLMRGSTIEGLHKAQS